MVLQCLKLVNSLYNNMDLKRLQELAGVEIKESDDVKLTKAAREVVIGKKDIKEIAKKYELNLGELEGEVGLVKDILHQGKGHLINVKEAFNIPSIDAESARQMRERAVEVRKAAKGSFGAIILAGMMQTNADDNSILAKAFPNMYKVYKQQNELNDEDYKKDNMVKTAMPNLK